MRCLVLSLGLVFLLSAVVPAAAASPVDFTGEWALDLEKSDQGEGFGGRRSMLALKMIVEQKDNALKVEAFRRNRDGEEMSMVSDYTLDGKECRNESGNRSTVSVLNWSEDGKALTIASTMTFSRDGQDFSMESTEIWSISEGALVVEATRSSPRGERKTRAVYNKAQK